MGFKAQVLGLITCLLLVLPSLALAQFQFCTPTYTNLCSSDDYVNLVILNTLNNSSSGCNGNANNYILYPTTGAGAFTTTLVQGNAYTLSVQTDPGPGYDEGFGVWIDFTNNGKFDDPGDFFYASPVAGTQLFTTTVNVPAGAAIANVRMRVRCRWNNTFTLADSCANFNYGETEDYTISVAAPSATDIALNNIFPPAGQCYNGTQPIQVELKNSGLSAIDFAISNAIITSSVSGAAVQTFPADTVKTGTLAPGATLVRTVSPSFNLLPPGTYTFTANVSLPGDGLTFNNTYTGDRVVTPTQAYPYVQDFNASTLVPTGITTSDFYVSSTHGKNGTNGLTYELWAFDNAAEFEVDKTGPIPANAYFAYDFRAVDYSSYPNNGTTFNTGDSVNVYLSTDCGGSFNLVKSYNASTHAASANYKRDTIPLAAYAGGSAIIRVKGKQNGGFNTDFYADFDNLAFEQLIAQDISVNDVLPPAGQCYNATQPIQVVIKNAGTAPINFATSNVIITSSVAGPTNVTFSNDTVKTGTLAPGATLARTVAATFNLSTPGTFTFAAKATLVGGAVGANDSLTTDRNVTTSNPLPYFEDFNASTSVPGSITTNSFYVDGSHGNNSTNGLTYEMFSTNSSFNFVLNQRGIVLPNSYLAYDFRFVDWSSYPNNATTLNVDDSINILISGNCGGSFSLMKSYNSSHTPSTSFNRDTVFLNSYTGNDIVVRVVSKMGNNYHDYFVDFDNIEIQQLIAQDISVSDVLPSVGQCYNATQPVQVVLKNSGTAALNFATNNVVITSSVIGQANQTFPNDTVKTGTLAPNATLVRTVSPSFNMTSAGTYTFIAKATLTGGVVGGNDSIQTDRTTTLTNPIPYSEDFNTSGGLPASISSNNFYVSSTHGNNASNGLTYELFSTNSSVNFSINKLGTVLPNTYFAYDYRFVNWSGYPNTGFNFQTGDSINVLISGDCGGSFDLVRSYNASNHTASNGYDRDSVFLTSYVGNDVIIRVVGKMGSQFGDFYIDFDNLIVDVQSPTDIGVDALLPGSQCYSANQTFQVSVKNTGTGPLNFASTPLIINSGVSGVLNLTFNPDTVSTGTLAPGATLTRTLSPGVNMSGSGTYTFDVTLTLPGDGSSLNNTLQTTRIVDSTYALPYAEDFNASTTLPSNITVAGTAFTNFNVNPTHGNTTNGLTFNLYGSFTSYFQLPQIGPATPQSYFAYDYRFVNWSGYPNTPTTLQSGDSINVLISTDCGGSFQLVKSYNPSNHTATLVWKRDTVDLAGYAGSNVIVKVQAKKGSSTTDTYTDFDNFVIDNRSPLDIGVDALLPGSQCYSANQTIQVRVKNTGTADIDFATNNLILNSGVSGPVNASFNPDTVKTGTLAVGATLTRTLTPNVNMTASGIYTFDVFANLAGDGALSNNQLQTTRKVDTTFGLPYAEDFDLTPQYSTPAGFTILNYNVVSNHGTGGSNGLTRNLYFGNNGSFSLPSVGTVPTGAKLKYDYRLVDYSSYPSTPTTLETGDSVNVFISGDCGNTFQLLKSYNASNHVPNLNFQTETFSLANYVGSNVIVRVLGKSGSSSSADFYSDFDNFTIDDAAPDVRIVAAQPNGLSCVLSATTPVSVTLVNTGNRPIDSANVVVQIAGVDTLSEVAQFTNFQPGDTVTYTFTGTVAIINNANYTVVGIVKASGDDIVSNDTLSVSYSTISNLASPTVTGPAAICFGLTASFTASSSASAYEWYNDSIGGSPIFSGATYQTAQLNATDTFYVLAIAGNCSSARKAVVIVVSPPLSLADVSGADTVLQGSTEQYVILSPNAGSTYSWTISNGTPATNIGTSLNITWSTTQAAGNITILETSSIGCTIQTVVPIVIDLTTATDPKLVSDYALTLPYPNPASNSVSLELTVPSTQLVTLNMHSIDGKFVGTLFSGSVTGKQTIEADVQNIASGVYMLRLQAGNFQTTRRLVISH
jgi:hypothetical protein